MSSDPAKPDPARPDEPIPRLSDALLDRVKEIADSIGDRVRNTLPPHAGQTPLRILVVDDYPDSADTLVELLDSLGYVARACYDGPAALAAVQEFHPHVCLLDLAMPGMNGLKLATELKAGASHGPLLLIATTAFGNLEMRTQTALVGFHYHLTKPVDLPKLVEALTRLERQLGQVEPGPPRNAPVDEPSGPDGSVS